jgi:hypothetical protein
MGYGIWDTRASARVAICQPHMEEHEHGSGKKYPFQSPESVDQSVRYSPHTNGSENENQSPHQLVPMGLLVVVVPY